MRIKEAAEVILKLKLLELVTQPPGAEFVCFFSQLGGACQKEVLASRNKLFA